jgi:hypothetical protein
VNRTAIVAVVLALLGASAAAEQAALELLPADEARISATGVAAPAEPGTALVFGRLDDPAFAIADPSQVTVVDANGKQLSLLIEEQSLFRDLGQIVSMRFVFAIPESELAAGGLQLKWGPEVRAANVVGEEIALAPVARERLRQFRWSRAPSSAEPPSVATIEVIADSHAGWYFLWYLLPISVVFALLTIRKIRARHSTD